jgi:hypothetical protein
VRSRSGQETFRNGTCAAGVRDLLLHYGKDDLGCNFYGRPKKARAASHLALQLNILVHSRQVCQLGNKLLEVPELRNEPPKRQNLLHMTILQAMK